MRAECLDGLLILNRRHLERVLRVYADHYNRQRPHRALDDTNITRFVELLRSYADRAQFIVVTHQKRTMEAADVLYGVTMGADGVSQIVSRRLPPKTLRRSRRRLLL